MGKRSNPYSEELVRRCKTHVQPRHLALAGGGRDASAQRTLELLYEGSSKCSSDTRTPVASYPPLRTHNTLKQLTHSTLKQLTLAGDGSLHNPDSVVDTDISGGVRCGVNCHSGGDTRCNYCERGVCAECVAQCLYCNNDYCHRCSLNTYDTCETVCMSCYP